MGEITEALIGSIVPWPGARAVSKKHIYLDWLFSELLSETCVCLFVWRYVCVWFTVRVLKECKTKVKIYKKKLILSLVL